MPLNYVTVAASLRLFNGVPAESKEKELSAHDYIDIPEYGVVISPGAAWLEEQIVSYLGRHRLSGEEFNKAFHKSWNKVWDTSELELISQQIFHYISTYGLQAIGIDSPEFIYIPNEELQLPEQLVFKVIPAIDRDELIKRCLAMLASGTALKSETLVDIFNLLDGLEYVWDGTETVKNREAVVMLADKQGVLPKNADDLFRYFFYKATGETLVIKNEKSYESIKNSKYKLPNLSEDQIIELSKSFNRRKPLWIKGFKQSHSDNRSIVNKISKASKAYHKPLKPTVLGTLTSKIHTPKAVRQAAEKASVMDIAKAINAVRLYASDTDSRFYKIRNGKGFPRVKERVVPVEQLLIYERELMVALECRLKAGLKIYCPPGIDYAIPVSEKQFSSAVPKGTSVEVLPKGDDSLLVGIYWEGYNSDLDLSAISSTVRIGWNTSHKRGGFARSGDITSAPNGATEWLFCDPAQINNIYLVTVNDYGSRHEVGSPYKIMVATSEDKTIRQTRSEPKYLCDPNNVIFELDTVLPQTQTLMGIIVPIQTEDDEGRVVRGMKFYLIDQGMPGGSVSSYSSDSLTIQKALVTGYETQLRLSDLVTLVRDPDQKSECDIDLSPQNLAKDTIMSLFD